MFLIEYNTAKPATPIAIIILVILSFWSFNGKPLLRYAHIHRDRKCSLQVFWNFWIENSYRYKAKSFRSVSPTWNEKHKLQAPNYSQQNDTLLYIKKIQKLFDHIAYDIYILWGKMPGKWSALKKCRWWTCKYLPSLGIMFTHLFSKWNPATIESFQREVLDALRGTVRSWHR